MTPARREIFMRLIKPIVANIRYEKHCLKDHEAAFCSDITQCPAGEHERDLRLFYELLQTTIYWFKAPLKRRR